MAYIYRDCLNDDDDDDNDECKTQLCKDLENDDKISECKCVLNKKLKDAVSDIKPDDSNLHQLPLGFNNDLLCRMTNSPGPRLYRCIENDESISSPVPYIPSDIKTFDTSFSVNENDDKHEDAGSDTALYAKSICYPKKKTQRSRGCKYMVCSKGKRKFHTCKDPQRLGKVLKLKNSSPDGNEKYIFIPKICRDTKSKKSTNSCLPYVCELDKSNNPKQCKALEYSGIAGIIPGNNPNTSLPQLRPLKQLPENNNLQFNILGVSVFPFLFLLIFILCYINMRFGIFGKRKKRKIRESKKDV